MYLLIYASYESEIMVLFHHYYKEVKNSHCQDKFYFSSKTNIFFLDQIKCLAPSETPTIPLYSSLKKQKQQQKTTNIMQGCAVKYRPFHLKAVIIRLLLRSRDTFQLDSLRTLENKTNEQYSKARLGVYPPLRLHSLF